MNISHGLLSSCTLSRPFSLATHFLSLLLLLLSMEFFFRVEYVRLRLKFKFTQPVVNQFAQVTSRTCGASELQIGLIESTFLGVNVRKCTSHEPNTLLERSFLCYALFQKGLSNKIYFSWRHFTTVSHGCLVSSYLSRSALNKQEAHRTLKRILLLIYVSLHPIAMQLHATSHAQQERIPQNKIESLAIRKVRSVDLRFGWCEFQVLVEKEHRYTTL